MLFSIERIEGELALLCDGEGRTHPIPRSALPADAAAGDVLRETLEGYAVDDTETAARRKRVRRLQEQLKNDGRFVSAVVPAAGSATRMGGEKQRLLLKGIPVLARTLQALEAAECISEIVLVAREADIEEFSGWRAEYGISKLTRVVAGGDTRQQSVYNGFLAVDPRATLVAIHDGARPLIAPGEIEALVEEADRYGTAAASTPVKDTVKITEDGVTVASTPHRATLRAVQTPQVFRRDLYEGALAAARASGKDFTDDCQLFEYAGYPVRLVPTGYRNIKITTPEDMTVAAALLGGEEPIMRIGHGYDVHRLVEGRKLILGGVDIPFEKGLLGHSDADVLTHAVMDAMLGAAALGDIGVWFPDTDEKWRGADSIVLLRRAREILQEHGFRPCNIDATLLAQAPRLRPHIHRMRENIAAACRLPLEAVSVKATTEEKLGFTGAGEGMAAHAVCIIDKEV